MHSSPFLYTVRTQTQEDYQFLAFSFGSPGNEPERGWAARTVRVPHLGEELHLGRSEGEIGRESHDRAQERALVQRIGRAVRKRVSCSCLLRERRRDSYPKMVISHSKMLSSSTNPAENPSTGFLRSSAVLVACAGREGRGGCQHWLVDVMPRSCADRGVAKGCWTRDERRGRD